MKHINKLLGIISFLSVSTFSSVSYGAVVECPNLTIKSVYVEGDRDDNFDHANKLVLKFDSPCSGSDLAFIENTHQAYNGFLSAALTAFTTDTLVSLYVNTSKTSGPANQISIILMQK